MFPYIYLPFIDTEWRTSSLLMAGSFVFMLWLILRLPVSLGRVHRCVLVAGGCLFSLYGARLFHVLVESPGFYWEHPAAIFRNFNGMTFYGSVIAGSLFLFLWSVSWGWDRDLKDRIWDQTSFGTAVILGVLRIGCFLNGCCWGKITGVPWSVRFFSMRGVMPSLGIPVHPVQLYEALLGFFIAIVLHFERRWSVISRSFGIQESGGCLFAIFCLIYGPGRFILEYFRGDSYRGIDILFGLSVSQLISLPVSLGGLLWMFRRAGRFGGFSKKKELFT